MKIDDLSRFAMPINRALNRDKIAKIDDFYQFFFEKVVIHNDFDKITVSYWRYDRRFYWKPRLIVQIEAIWMTWVVNRPIWWASYYNSSFLPLDIFRKSLHKTVFVQLLPKPSKIFCKPPLYRRPWHRWNHTTSPSSASLRSATHG